MIHRSSRASPGMGSANHLAGELFLLQTKVKITHIPYKGSGEAVIAAASGQAPVGFPSLAGAIPMLDNGRLRALAVTSLRRATSLPNVPTLAEAGLPAIDADAWFAYFAPPRTPTAGRARSSVASQSGSEEDVPVVKQLQKLAAEKGISLDADQVGKKGFKPKERK